MTESTPRRQRPLYRDPIDKKIGGVASGVARYFDIDTTLVRAAWAVTALFGGFGILLYLVLWVILDDDPDRLAELSVSPVEPGGADEAETEEGGDDQSLAAAHEEIEAETFEPDVEEARL